MKGKFKAVYSNPLFNSVLLCLRLVLNCWTMFYDFLLSKLSKGKLPLGIHFAWIKINFPKIEWIFISYSICERNCVFYIPEPLTRGYKTHEFHGISDSFYHMIIPKNINISWKSMYFEIFRAKITLKRRSLLWQRSAKLVLKVLCNMSYWKIYEMVLWKGESCD